MSAGTCRASGPFPQEPYINNMMWISAKAEYACLAVIELAKTTSGLPKRAGAIAEAQGIPERYLAQILLRLKATGLVQSTRGPAGGYQLIRPTDEFSVADIIGAIDGPDDPPRKIASPAAQELVDLLKRARAAERQVLTSTTIAELTGPLVAHDWVL